MVEVIVLVFNEDCTELMIEVIVLVFNLMKTVLN